MLSRHATPPARLRFRADKAAEAIALIARSKPGLTQDFIGTILYFADKAHFLDYGRLITCDRYLATKDGPVPSAVQAMLAAATTVDLGIPPTIRATVDDNARMLLARVRVEREASASGERQRVYPSSRSIEPRLLSTTDVDCLNASIEEHGDRSAGDLWDQSHQDEAWNEAWCDRANGRAAEMNILLWAAPEEREAFRRQLCDYNM